MKDGILNRATRVPWMAPTPAQISTAATIASHHGKPGPPGQVLLTVTTQLEAGGGWTSSATTTAPSAMTSPTDRSISPEQQGKDLGHRQQHVDGALPEQVDQVLG